MRIDLRARRTLRFIALLAMALPVVTRAYLVGSPDGLDKMTTNADLICKARVIASDVISNSPFQEISGFEVREAKLEIISTLKGNAGTNVVRFQHYASRSGFGFYSPQHYQLEAGHSYLLFAAKTGRAGEFRPLRSAHTMKPDEGVMRTLDARPLTGLSVKEAHWSELNLLLSDSAPSNSLYAIHQLDALSARCARTWGQLNDFSREAVLKTLLPFCTHTNDEVAVASLQCFQTGAGCEAQISPHAGALIQIADSAASIPRRVAALAAFSGTKLAAVSNALSRWLGDASESVRIQSVALLPEFPGDFANDHLRRLAADESARTRAAVADAIGNGKIAALLPTLKTLLAEPVAKDVSSVEGAVHTHAAQALMKFDGDEVRDLLKANLPDEAFRPDYLCKLAEKDAAPWLDELTEMLEQRRARILKEVEASGVEPKTNYFRARMALAGTYFKGWNIIYEHLQSLSRTAFAEGKLDRCLDALESAGNTGSREPVMLYELYRTKGLKERAARYRREAQQQFAGYNLDEFFNQADARSAR